MLTEKKIDSYIAILEEELIPATGCTEPIAIALAAARLREVLGARPERITAELSGNIIKNAKSAVVPNTGGMRGVEAAIAAGVTAGDARRLLQVISDVPESAYAEMRTYAQSADIRLARLDTPRQLDILLTGFAGGDRASVRIANNHTSIVFEEKNGETLKALDAGFSSESSLTDKNCLNIEDIVAFADSVELERVRGPIERQIRCNSAIAREGIEHEWGAGVGRTVLERGEENIDLRCRAFAAAGSDARMSGCELPVVIVSGSGNQGITASVPVICYAAHMAAEDEKLIRALLVSNLVTIHQKTGIGRLSAYCGAVSAGCGAACGIAYLHGADAQLISRTVVNCVAMLSGMVCDGAKPSCAAKIACAVEAGLLAWKMSRKSRGFTDGDGILDGGVEGSIANVGRLAHEGMQETDKVILSIMTGN